MSERWRLKALVLLLPVKALVIALVAAASCSADAQEPQRGTSMRLNILDARQMETR